MSPRPYRMKKRTAAVAETRQRIVEATVDLHGRKGIFGTSWQDIAREADVAVGTVYKHFPTLDELVPACGALLMERIRPPSPKDAEAIIGDATEPEERLRRVTRALFDFYRRGGNHLQSDPRERELPAMREWETFLREMVSHFVGRALRDLASDEDRIEPIAALLDVGTCTAMVERKIPHDEAVEHVVAMAMAWLTRRSQDESPPVPGGQRGRTS